MNRSKLICSHTDETLIEDNLKDEFRNIFLINSLDKNINIWRWTPVPIKDWILGKRYLNLSGVVRKPVFDDIVTFFESVKGNPWNRKYDEAVFCEGIGSGKTQAPETEVLMFNGKVKRYKDIKKGDLVMGNDSKPRKVLEVHKVYDEAYEITPVKGEKKIVKYNHILSLKRTNKGQINRYRQNGGSKDGQSGKIVNISVEDYIKKSKKFKMLHKLWRIGVSFRSKSVKIDPYWLGIWLGDGHSNTTAITTKDEEIIKYNYNIATQRGLSTYLNYNKNKSCPSYVITGRRKKINSLQKDLLFYSLIRNKHIPFDYKVNSEKVRLQILAGLIDSDGHLSKSCLDFSNKNKRLCEDVVFLCRSLGLAAYMKERYTSCKGKKFLSYRVTISGDLDRIPSLLSRKQSLKRKQKKNVLMTGIRSIKAVGKRILIGFSVDKNHLYLDGDFTVMHNSFKTSIIATYFQHLLLCLKNPQGYFGGDKSSKIAIMNMSISERNAVKVIFSEMKSKIENCRWFQERPWEREDARMPDPICKSELRFKNNTFIIPGSSNWRTAVGYNIIVGIMDEAGSYRKTDNSDQAEDIYHALERRLGSRFESRGAIVIAGSPFYEGDFLERKVIEGQKGGNRTYSQRRSIWDAKYYDWSGDYFYVDRVNRIVLDKKPEKMDNIDKIPAVKFLVKAFRANVTKAYRDFGARPSTTINAFFENPRLILERANRERSEEPIRSDGTFKEWFKCIAPQAFHTIHIDLALSGDACGFCLGHYDGETKEGSARVYIDLLIRLQGSKESKVQIAKVRDYIYALSRMGFPIGLVTFDGFQSADSIQILQSKGYTSELLSVDRTVQPYYNLKSVINEDRIDFYHCPNKNDPDNPTPSEVVVKELMRLEEIEGKKIDHPPKGSKDVADGLAGVVHNILTNSDYYGAVQI